MDFYEPSAKNPFSLYSGRKWTSGAEVSDLVNKRKQTANHELTNDYEHPTRTRQQLPSWLQKQDLTEADLPYIHSLLVGSFADWLEEVDGFPWLGGKIILLHPDFTSLASGGEEEENEF